MSEKKIPVKMKAIMNLSPEERYQHSIKQICGWHEAYVLDDDGYILYGDEDENQYLAIWPNKEYANFFISTLNLNYKVEPIDIDDLVNEILEDLEKNKICVGVFLMPDLTGVVLNPEDFKRDLLNELKNYP